MASNKLFPAAPNRLMPDTLDDGSPDPNATEGWQQLYRNLTSPTDWGGVGREYANALLMGSTAPAEGGALASAMRGLRAYHGSPHSFDRFSLDKIGTGEGAQAYGHGLYFAQNEATAKYYRDALSQERGPSTYWKDSAGNTVDIGQLRNAAETGDPMGFAAAMLHQSPSVDAAIADTKMYGPSAFAGGKAEHDATLQGLQQMKEAGLQKYKDNGHMYEVNLDIEPHELLDWDKPLSEQHPKVQEALQQAGVPSNATTGQEAYHGLAQSALQEKASLEKWFAGKKADGDTRSFPNEQAQLDAMQNPYAYAADKLNQAGVKGISYLDAGSRSANGGTSNIVAFDPATIEIIRKYGIGALGLGTAAAAAGGQDQQ